MVGYSYTSLYIFSSLNLLFHELCQNFKLNKFVNTIISWVGLKDHPVSILLHEKLELRSSVLEHLIWNTH